MRYEEIPAIDLPAAEAGITSGVPSQIADALLRASLSLIDPTWVEAACLRSLAHPDLEVRWAALSALGHLARRYRRLDIGDVLAAVKPLRDNPALAGKVSDLLDDIDTYVRASP